jgi:tetratricopeptide (TPR) repeat protein
VIEFLLDAENLLALGLLDQAERTYRTVLEADPRNGIAAVGLSRVALERGDDAGAHALARAALAIDPENATARRMIDRLDEVARYRDAAPATPPAPADPPADPPADDSEAMIRASSVLVVDPDEPAGARATADRPDSAGPEHDGSTPRVVESGQDGVEWSRRDEHPPPPAAQAAAEHETSTRSQQPGAGAGPNGMPTGAANQAASANQVAAPPQAASPGFEPEPVPPIAAAHQVAPARPGLLRRILRRS